MWITTGSNLEELVVSLNRHPSPSDTPGSVAAEEGHKFILIANEAIQARLAALRAIEKAEGGEERYLEHLAETQKLSTVTIEAVIRTGELLAEPRKVPIREPSVGSGSFRGSEPSLPPTIDKKRSYMYQTLKKHEDKVRELVEEALKGEGIPMWRAILAKLLKKTPKDPVDLPDGVFDVIVVDPP